MSKGQVGDDSGVLRHQTTHSIANRSISVLVNSSRGKRGNYPNKLFVAAVAIDLWVITTPLGGPVVPYSYVRQHSANKKYQETYGSISNGCNLFGGGKDGFNQVFLSISNDCKGIRKAGIE